MRSYSFDFETATPVRLYTITRRDAVVKRFTNWLNPITIGSETFAPAVGIVEYDISERNDGAPASTQIGLSAYAGGLITEQDISDRTYEKAEIEIDLCDAENPTAKDFHFYGRLASQSKPLHGVVTFEARNPHAFPRLNLVPRFSVMCRFAFGGLMCGVPVMRPDVARLTAYVLGDTVRKLTGLSPAGYGNRYFEVTTAGTTASSSPSYNYTIAATTTDGSVVFTARNAWERAFEINAPVNRHNMTLTASVDARDVDNWFAPGKIMFTSGRNKNRVFRVGAWRQSDLQLTTYLPAGLLAGDGDVGFIWPDCDKTLAMCAGKYANGRRLGGFPYYEGAKAVVAGA